MAIRQEQLHDEQDVDLFARYMRSLLAKGEGFFVQPSDDIRTCTTCGARAAFFQAGRGGWSRCSECGALA